MRAKTLERIWWNKLILGRPLINVDGKKKRVQNYLCVDIRLIYMII
jgi:hypothetical protein